MPPDIKKSLQRFIPQLLKAREENLSEADTSLRIFKVFEEVLGYDIGEISKEKEVREKFVDFAIKVDRTIRFFVEVKAAGVDLKDKYIDKTEIYAAEGNIPWVLLTNGVLWNLYHLTFDKEKGMDYERVFSVQVGEDPIERVTECLSVLHRQSVACNKHEEFWLRGRALGPAAIGKALFTEGVIRLIRREIRHQPEKILLDEEDLARAIHQMLSEEARVEIGPPKIRRGYSMHKKGARSQPEAQQAIQVPEPSSAHLAADNTTQPSAPSSKLPTG
jgi:hypothetical protein